MVVFGESLSLLSIRNQQFIPKFLEKCFNFLLQKEKQVEGLFRINASERELRKLQTTIDATGDFNIDENTSPYAIANLITRFIGMIPEHLLIDSNAGRWDKIMTEGMEKTEVYRNARHLVKKLPPLNRALFSRLIAFFMILAKNESKTRMGIMQFSIILSPILVEKQTDRTWLFKHPKVMVFFENYDKIFSSCSSLENDLLISLDVFEQKIGNLDSQYFLKTDLGQVKLTPIIETKPKKMCRHVNIEKKTWDGMISTLLAKDKRANLDSRSLKTTF